MINQKPHDEEKIILFIDGELNKDQCKEVKEHLKHCSECKKIYLQYLNVHRDTSLFYKAVDPGSVRIKLRPAEFKDSHNYRYAIVAILFLFTSIIIILLNTKQSEKINAINLIQVDQFDLEIINIEREIDYLENQLSRETL